MRLLPPDRALGWMPYVWLVYLGVYIAFPFVIRPDPLGWAAQAAGLVAFLALYFGGHWLEGSRRLAIVVAIAVLGLLLIGVNPGALVFFIYAASFVAGSRAGRQAVAWIAGVTALAIGAMWLSPWWSPAMVAIAAVFPPLIGFVNLRDAEVRQRDASLRLAHDEIARLATLAERDRIAGDLHDLLGHTLSVIVLKAELASKLVARDPAKAAAEIAEVERVSREALGEVRRAVHGFRQARLADELARARGVLEAAGVAVTSAGLLSAGSGRGLDGLSPETEHALALVLREAVTNVIRHARASHCRVALARSDGQWTLTVEDDGVGGAVLEGHGLGGMRARLGEVGGRLEWAAARGMRLTASVPVRDRQTQEAPA
jgi:two-component system sensor histidine kinase DesK